MSGLKLERIEKENNLLFSSMSVESPSELSISIGDSLNNGGEEVVQLAMGKPLQASSPSIGMVGEGDGHTLRSVLTTHLSPIHRSFGNHHINSTTMETPTPPSSLDAFISHFDHHDDIPQKRSRKRYSLRQELLLTEKIDAMDDTEVKKMLAKVLVDNLGLRQELKSRDKRITAYKGQMLAILDWKVKEKADEEDNSKCEGTKGSSTPDEFSFSSSEERREVKGSCSCHSVTKPGFGRSCGENTLFSGVGNASAAATLSQHGVQEVTVVDEVYGIRRSLSFFQEFASSIEVDQEVLRDRIKDGCYLTNQLLMGGVSGWMTAIFMKKFGKIVLSAAGGGLVLLVYTTKKGYVNVNYESVYREISLLCEDNVEIDSDDNDNGTSGFLKGDRENNKFVRNDSILDKTRSQECWGLEKVKAARKWISSHTYTVGGFVLSFMYNIF